MSNAALIQIGDEVTEALITFKNDETIRAIKLIAGALADAVIEAHGGVQETLAEETAEAVEVAADAE